MVSVNVYMTIFFIGLFERAFGVMKNGIFSWLHSWLPSCSGFSFMQIRWLVTLHCGHKMI